MVPHRRPAGRAPMVGATCAAVLPALGGVAGPCHHAVPAAAAAQDS